MIGFDKGRGQTEEEFVQEMLKPIYAMENQIVAFQNAAAAFSYHLNKFLIPFQIASGYIQKEEARKLISEPPIETLISYVNLASFSMDIASSNMRASMRIVNEYMKNEMPRAISAWIDTLFRREGEDIFDYAARQAKTMERVAQLYPEAIDAIAPEFGFKTEENIKFAETDRFVLYQVLPTDKSVAVREDGKPVLIIPPFVLGHNILSFLPGENRSYVHCFANQGIPTYLRTMKDIQETPALQTMTKEDDTNDIRFFCEKIRERHGKPVTLNGYCQGGFMTLCGVLSGELDGLVDAMITNVSPMDGTRSKGLHEFLEKLPKRFNSLKYGTKTLPNGNIVMDGELMGWVYKLKSIEAEAPLVALFRDMMMLAPKDGKPFSVSKTAAAINYWLQYERTDLPAAITEMSFAAYNIPIDDEGNLPIRLYGRKLNLKRIQDKGMPWLICYGERDDLVEPETALAPLDYIDAEVAAFPKGHVAIATSWSDPTSACALHTRFGEKNHRGPVRFHLDLEKEASTASEPPPEITASATSRESTAGEPPVSA